MATHLSAGYDSGTVTATAARLLRGSGGKVLAFTSAPREGFAGDVPRGRVADESPYAAETAKLHPNVQHIFVRSKGVNQLSLLDRTHELVQYPVGQLSNNVWWSAINAEASSRGARVILTGQAGNHTLSAGGWGCSPILCGEENGFDGVRKLDLSRGRARLDGLECWRTPLAPGRRKAGGSKSTLLL